MLTFWYIGYIMELKEQLRQAREVIAFLSLELDGDKPEKVMAVGE